jgi:hypothetical protein
MIRRVSSAFGETAFLAVRERAPASDLALSGLLLLSRP